MPRPFVVGLDCGFYINTDRATNPPNTPWDPTAPNPSHYTEVQSTRDLTLNLTTSTADATSRQSNGWRQNVVVLREGSVDANILWLPDDTVFQTLLNGYLTGCPIDGLVLDGPIDGITTPNDCGDQGVVTGMYADWTVTDFSRNEGMEDVLTADVTLEIGRGIVVPEWISDVTAVPT